MSDPIDLVATAAAGDRRKTLEALRDTLARTIVEAEPSNVAALGKQLRDTMTELDALPDAAREVDPVEQIIAASGGGTVLAMPTGGGVGRGSGDRASRSSGAAAGRVAAGSRKGGAGKAK